MPRFHVSEDGQPRPCKASEGKCPLSEEDGSPTPHGEFATVGEAQAFAEAVNAKRYGSSAPTAMRKAADEGARRGKVLMEKLDEAYQEAGQSKAVPFEETPQGRYEAADRAWRQARAEFADPQVDSTLTRADIEAMAEERDGWAYVTGNAASQVALRQEQVARGKEQVNQTLKTVKELSATVLPPESQGPEARLKAGVNLDRALGEEKKRLEAGRAALEAGLAPPKELAYVDYHLAKLDLKIAETRAEATPTLGPRPRLVGRSEWDKAKTNVDLNQALVVEKQALLDRAEHNWRSLKQS